MEPIKSIAWKDMNVKIGDYVTCYSNIEKENGNDFWVDKLVIGNKYKIDDLEWRFWDRICVKGEYGNSQFFPAEFFYCDLIEKRNKKIDDIIG
jgi:hypothetical protein